MRKSALIILVFNPFHVDFSAALLRDGNLVESWLGLAGTSSHCSSFDIIVQLREHLSG
jgi:hypothetical protein